MLGTPPPRAGLIRAAAWPDPPWRYPCWLRSSGEWTNPDRKLSPPAAGGRKQARRRWPARNSASRRSTRASGSSASCTTISVISISSRRPCSRSTTRSDRSPSPTFQLRPWRPDRGALLCIRGMADSCLAPLSRSTPEARRGAARAGLTATARAEQQCACHECVTLQPG